MISWIIIGRNWMSTLSELIISINSQTAYKKYYEVIFVDDYSNDESIDKLEEYTKQNNFQLIKSPSNLGRSAARNKGIERSNSKWCIFSNSNIIPPHNFIDDYINKIKTINADILVGAIKYTCPNDNKFEIYLNSKNRGSNSYKENDKIPYFLVLFGNCAISKQILNTHTFNESIKEYGGEELEYMWRITQHYPKVNILKLNTAVLRINHPTFIQHCHRIENFGKQFIKAVPIKIQKLIISNYLFKIKFIIPTKIIISLLKKLYKYSPIFMHYIIRFGIGLSILKGIKESDN